MKKCLVFIVSIVLLYVVSEILSGVILTFMYTPDFSSSGSFSSNEVTFGTHSGLFPVMLGVLTATLAYFISGKVQNVSTF